MKPLYTPVNNVLMLEHHLRESPYLSPFKGKKRAGCCRNRKKPFGHMTVKPFSGLCEILGVVLRNPFHSTL